MNENDLKKLRDEITSLDKEGAKYLNRRFEVAKKVAEYKLSNGGEIFVLERERQVISDAKSQFPINMGNKIESIMGTIMRISRENQYEIIYPKDNIWSIKEIIQSSEKTLNTPTDISCQGTVGAYSYIAANKLFPDSKRIMVTSFDECIQNVADGKTQMAILPLENTTAGIVNDVYDLIVESNLYIVKAITIPIEHKLVVLPGTKLEQITTVMSHPQALAQCSKFIKNMGWEQIAIVNTAVASKRVYEDKNPNICAISSSQAAKENDLEILPVEICDYLHNQTRFVVISKTPVIEKNINRISLSFTVAHATQSGSLSSVLNVFAERGLSMTKIQSRPVPQKPWEYSFWVDLDATGDKMEINLALYQLSKELPKLDILGWYEEI